MYKTLEGMNLEELAKHRKEDAKPGAKESPWLRQVKIETHFADGMVGNFRMKRRSTADILVSILGHTIVVAILILIPLLYTQALNTPQLQTTFLAAPPPPPPAPPPPAEIHIAPKGPKSFFNQGKLYAPKFIPKQIAQVKEAPPQAPATGVEGGVIGGVPGGQLGGVLGGILGGNRQIAPPPPPEQTAHNGPYRVGGRVRAPLLISQVKPDYPPLAKMTRIQGDVVIDSVIDEHGQVTQMKVVSGNPLLIGAAMQALEQWKYQPTLLNGQPVAVDMVVTVHFQLGGEAS